MLTACTVSVDSTIFYAFSFFAIIFMQIVSIGRGLLSHLSVDSLEILFNYPCWFRSCCEINITSSVPNSGELYGFAFVCLKPIFP